jgi:hypothetical protein
MGVLGRERFSDGKGLAVGRKRARSVALLPEQPLGAAGIPGTGNADRETAAGQADNAGTRQ